MKTINIKLLGYTPPTPQGEKRPSNLELPYGMTLSRFANTHTIELIGKYRVSEYDAEPTRVCHIVIDKPSRSAEIELNQRPLLTITAEHGSPRMLEYIAVKAHKLNAFDDDKDALTDKAKAISALVAECPKGSGPY